MVVRGADCEASQEIMGSVVLGLALLDEYFGEEDEGVVLAASGRAYVKGKRALAKQ